eukprot:56646-Eustigmatos_ZCMA.PRE.1
MSSNGLLSKSNALNESLSQQVALSATTRPIKSPRHSVPNSSAWRGFSCSGARGVIPRLSRSHRYEYGSLARAA